MSGYSMFFDYDGMVYQFPVNPEQMEVSSTLAIEKYEVLKLGQIAVPTNMELHTYSFECEFPHISQSYTETNKDFKDSDYYLGRFKRWRKALVPVRFIATNGISNDINTLVLIEDLTVTEKAGEEGDKYVSFSLLEYKEFGKKTAIIKTATAKSPKKAVKKKTVKAKANPKSTGSYIVKSGDSLWSIAKKLYGDGNKNNIIYNANKDKIKNSSVIQVGWKLKIPTESEFSKYSASLPKMKVSTKTVEKVNKYIGTKGVAGISALLDNTSDDGHSGGGRGF